MSGVYSMTGGPSYTGASRQDLFDSAMNQPLSLTSTLLDQAKGGILESFGLGTAIKDLTTPQGNEAPSIAEPAFGMAAIPIPGAYSLLKSGVQALTDQGQPLTEDAYKGSASFRKDIPWDQGMTDTRAAALAASDDAKKVREYYATKRPFASFVGAMAGQALDPVNYVPVFGEAVQAAAIGRFGFIGGRALVAGADAALNTGIAGAVTSGARGSFGDDVSWQGLISQMATAAMIGGAFGTLHGVFGSRVDARAVSEAEQRLATLRTTQEARIALNEGIDAVANGEDIKLSPNATEPMQRVAGEVSTIAAAEPPTYYHGGPANITEFSDAFRRDGTPKDKYDVRGIYVTENRTLAEQYVGKDGKVHEVHIDAKNPVTLPDARFPEIDSAALSSKDVETLRAAGYDSVINKERMEIAVFDGKQIRRKGAFNPDAFDWAAPMPERFRAEAPPGVAQASDGKIPQAERVLAYHGTTAPKFEKFDISKAGTGAGSKKEQAVFFAPHPEEAYGFAISGKQKAEPRVEAVELDTRNFLIVDDLAHPNSSSISRKLEEAKAAGADGVIFRNMDDRSPDQKVAGAPIPDQIALLNPDKAAILPNERATPALRQSAIDTSTARRDPAPEGIKQAEASIAKPEDTKNLAEQYRVDPQTGTFPEEADLHQLSAEGRFTEHDAATMAQAQTDYETGSAFAEALRSVASCLL